MKLLVFFFLLFFLSSISSIHTLKIPSKSSSPLDQTSLKKLNNETIIYKISKQLCWNCLGEAIQFLFHHNLVRATKMELPLTWDSNLENYAKWWASSRRQDCRLMHSFPEGDFKLGENIYWGSGNTWTPSDAVNAWADEQKYYDYASNSCVEGQLCGHYTQIVWKSTRKVGCARVICDSGDVFMTCNYFPPGNYIGEKPY
ncbi:Pathogenesis-related protein PR-1 [Capsicum baccatum]|uniref:Pathogenesis-related protein PR-1 n=2 Tax=Capsicum TaxID=4071 RepID=A0A1U8H8G8_CAPAN|nr:pathogenesis-related protein PR-1 [Capsicum annuum]PHT42207.1 Pathogenesis-related protein PR-1 [Capsicum baccatum]PHT75199.1 Pathogenesis-related protein PR-1 [Capsicum annuum]